MILVTKATFQDMLKRKFMSQNFKQWYITSSKKGGHRKKRYVSDDVYEAYINNIEGRA